MFSEALGSEASEFRALKSIEGLLRILKGYQGLFSANFEGVVFEGPLQVNKKGKPKGAPVVIILT